MFFWGEAIGVANTLPQTAIGVANTPFFCFLGKYPPQFHRLHGWIPTSGREWILSTTDIFGEPLEVVTLKPLNLKVDL